MILKRILAGAAAALTLCLSVGSFPAKAPLSASAAEAVTFTSFDTSVNGGEVIRGVDVSSVIALEKAGVKFRNDQGQEQDLFKTLAENGVNYIRVRVWNDPYDSSGNSYGGGNNDVDTACQIAARAAKYGMKLLVDIQYSDFWADPAKQTRPKYWAEHDIDTLSGEIYKWTTWVLKSVTEAGGQIGMVQVGNETNCFFCGETDMNTICKLFASGNKAVRDFDKNILIAHHFANPSNTEHYLWYAKAMNDNKLDYDVFATSYYPYWHGTTENLTSVLKKIGDTYGKYVMVAEMAYPYTDTDGDFQGNAVTSQSSGCDMRYPVSVEGQSQCIRDVYQAVANTGKWGIGVFYWEPAWLGVPGDDYYAQKAVWEETGSGWATKYAVGYDQDVSDTGGSSYDNQGLFDSQGKPMESLRVFGDVFPKKENVVPEEGAQITDGSYRIRSLASGMYLTVENGEGKPGGNVFQFSADGAADYNIWNIKAAGDGYYEIYSAIDGGETYLLDLDYGKADDRTNIGIYTNTFADAQKFKFLEAEDGYVILTKSSGDKSAVEVADSSREDGGNVQQLTRNGSLQQIWVLEPVEELIICGDLSGDGRVSVFDLIMLRQKLLDSQWEERCDVNSDSQFNMNDLVSLQSFLLGRSELDRPTRGTPRNTIFPRK